MPVSYSENLGKLEEDIGYSFRDRALLIEALTHRSYRHENPDRASSCNERLEFIGDSVLALAIVEYLFNYPKAFSEAEMAKIKSHLVKGSLLSEIAAFITLGAYVRLGKGEEETGGRSKKSILANAMEAVFGAVYLDGGYEVARKVILTLFREKILAVISSGQYHSYKTELQEVSQLHYGVLPEYRLVSQEGQEHRKTFTVDVYIVGEPYGRGAGRNKKEAETAAAKEALEKLKV